MKKITLEKWIKELNELKEQGIKVISSNTLRQKLGLNKDAFKVAVWRLEKKGFLIRLNRRWIAIDKRDIWKVIPVVWGPAYISMEWALHYHSVLDQRYYVFTCVTTKRPQIIKSKIGDIVLKHIKEELFFGYDQNFIAHPEKALLDILYLKREMPYGELNLEFLDSERLQRYSEKYPNWIQKKIHEIILAIESS